ncbi:hypothetical protein ILT44_15835 [Microvirga sp. BT689]|uniref:hypothetical protein n=1 Tax=Microvirga arvi TaxID=2778731 RepID=UPI0019523871|nr:hypothetical protein [Microvirga arvi]MBM6581668.1 hypothetical protein [Microvirga arvi]
MTNLIHRAATEDEAWIEEMTTKVGDWRSLSRSVYLRWAITINASELAESRYRALDPDQGLHTTTLRVVDGAPRLVPLAVWTGPEAADNYRQTTPLIAAYGVADLYGALEDIVFDAYEVFLRHHPETIIQGPEFLELRRLHRRRTGSAEALQAWQAAWAVRYGNWRRKKAYDGLPRVLRAFFTQAGLRRPSQYRHTDIDDWCRTLEMIAELRHHVVHGMGAVSERLAELSGTPTSLTFDFVAGAPLEIKLHHLQSVECFADQLLTALNLSLIERAIGPVALPPEPSGPGRG